MGFVTATVGASALAISYVLSLYVWSSPHDRDHPHTIKRRFVSAFCTLFVSPAFLYALGGASLVSKNSHLGLFEVIGFRREGLLAASTLPLVLTAVLFLGPMCMAAASTARLRLSMMPAYWNLCLRDLIWWRNHVVAPFTEEYTFRACMIPILMGYFSVRGAVIVAPFFFGIAHLHHMVERIRKGQDLRTALFISLFQMSYTTVFGMYSAFLFVRTANIAAPVIAHGFCNFMGFPDFMELMTHRPATRLLLAVAFLIGLGLFYVLLFPLTEPAIYANEIYHW